jgi:hypothetical protein
MQGDAHVHIKSCLPSDATGTLRMTVVDLARRGDCSMDCVANLLEMPLRDLAPADRRKNLVRMMKRYFKRAWSGQPPICEIVGV